MSSMRDYNNAPVTPGSVLEAYEKTYSTPMLKEEHEVDRRRRCSPYVLGNIFIAVGVILAIISILFATFIPKTVNSKVESGVVQCKPEDYQKESFLDSYGDCEDCNPFYFNVYMFNITNPASYLKEGGDEKMKLREVGPYAFRKRTFKSDVVLDGDIVSYKSYNSWTFEPTMSCQGCTENDTIVGFDTGYMNLISQTGGETGFLTNFFKGGLLPLDDALIPAKIQQDGKKILQFFYGLNSLDPKTMKTLAPSITTVLGAKSALPIENLKTSGFLYNGLFVKRTVRQWALGYPSFLVGAALGTNYINKCNAPFGNSTSTLLEQCTTCSGAECIPIAGECDKCKTGARILAFNDRTCDKVEAIYASEYGAEEAKKFTASTCRQCSTLGLCVAPLPGSVEKSGLDWSKQAPPPAVLTTSAQRTGCDDQDMIGDYTIFQNTTSIPLFVKLNEKRNPTVQELIQYKAFANCDKPTANLTCAPVFGGDGTGFKPAGVSAKGLASETSTESRNMYVSPAQQNVTVFNTKEQVTYKGIDLIRFRPANDVLHAKPWNEFKGTGVPVDGVQNLGFTSGFLAYVSYPMFLYGDKSLLEGVDITMVDGVQATYENMYDGDKLKKPYFDRLTTYLDMEPTTGKTMHAYKRLQASYALNKSPFDPSKPISDITHPNLKSEVIVPVYWGEESAGIKDSKVATFENVRGIMNAIIPILVIGLLLGFALIGFGIFYRVRAKRAASAYGV